MAGSREGRRGHVHSCESAAIAQSSITRASAAKSSTIRSGWCGVSPNGRLRRSMNAVRIPYAFAPMQSNAWLATKSTLGTVDAEPLAGHGVRGMVGLEVPGLLDRDAVVEFKPDMRFGRFEHVRVAVGQDGQAVAPAKHLQCVQHVGKGLQPLDLRHEPAHLLVRVVDAGPAHDVRDRAVSDVPVRGVTAIAQRIDHRVLEVRAPPPGDETVRVSGPALAGKERGHRGRQPRPACPRWCRTGRRPGS